MSARAAALGCPAQTGWAAWSWSPEKSRGPRSSSAVVLSSATPPDESEKDELRHWVDELRREVGPPRAQDQKLAALAPWIALARSS